MKLKEWFKGMIFKIISIYLAPRLKATDRKSFVFYKYSTVLSLIVEGGKLQFSNF